MKTNSNKLELGNFTSGAEETVVDIYKPGYTFAIFNYIGNENNQKNYISNQFKTFINYTDNLNKDDIKPHFLYIRKQLNIKRMIIVVVSRVIEKPLNPHIYIYGYHEEYFVTIYYLKPDNFFNPF